MGKLDLRNFGDCEYLVTLFHCTCISTEDRAKAANVFRKTLNAIFETSTKVIQMQIDYNKLLGKYQETPLPTSASGDERWIMECWESAYAAATAAAFVGWEVIPAAAHFEIECLDDSRLD